MTFSHRLVVASWLTAGLFACLGCGAQKSVLERRPDGIYHLKCKDASLSRCLVDAEAACDHNQYAVLRAFDDHQYMGRIAGNDTHEVRESEVFFACGMRATWGTELTKLRKAPLEDAKLCLMPSPAPAAPPPARVCTPGATQACVGPAGCSGGQACAPDGAAFAPCDCGTAPTPP